MVQAFFCCSSVSKIIYNLERDQRIENVNAAAWLAFFFDTEKNILYL